MPNVVEIIRDNAILKRKVRNLRVLAPLALLAGIGLGWHAFDYQHPRPEFVAHVAADGQVLEDAGHCFAPEYKALADGWEARAGEWEKLARECVADYREANRKLEELARRWGAI